MKLLFDENLSRKLVERLGDRRVAPDRGASVWEHAKAPGFAIVTADADFYEMATAFGPPPKVIWLRGCDCPTQTATRLIREQAVQVVEFLTDKNRAIL